MTTAHAPFRELKGIGPSTEAKLHEAGIRTWAALAETLDALARVRDVDAKRLRVLRDEARDKVDEPLPAAGDGEQTSRFIVVVTAQADGQIARTNVTDIRSELAKSFTGLSGTDIVGFIEQRIGARASTPEERDEVASLPSSLMDTATEFDPSTPIRFQASSDARDIVVVDVGMTIGARERDIELRWDTADIHTGDADKFRYHALLAGRPYGRGDVASWRSLGSLTGIARPGEMVDLGFETTELAPGINRLELTIEVQPTPSGEPGGVSRRVAAAMTAG